ncbi:porin family protein [Moraxella sp. VT-16-12]|uniref:porin family protein n=1 Tax=Moraxella sp. VT-16-12 TaxID=2014877 RepID=UPI000B7E928C|nr:porin family protein [Moraxella sp. VT-16-12]TWV81325.1 porin family protein [Moraxella sp. VT-16-12]
MKTLTKAILALTAASVMTLSANAKISYGNAGEPYVGVKAGQFDIDRIQGHKGDLTAYGVYGGYNFDQNLGIEAEYQGADSDKYKFNGTEYELKAKTYGAYGTYRYQFANTPVYVKGKLGVAKTEVKDKSISDNSYSHETDKTSLAGGVGVGFKPTKNLGVEATYNYLNSDASVWGVGAHLAF